MEISIITSMFNKNRETIEAIDSLFFNSIINHGGKDRELIIIDDYSPLKSETKKLFEKHKKNLISKFGKVIFFRNEKNYGFSGSFNRGISLAKGKILIIVNDDVYLPKDSVTSLAKVLKESESYGISSPITGERRTISIQYCKQAPKIKDYSEEQLKKIELFANYARKKMNNKRIKTDYIAGFCFAISSQLMKDYGGFDERFRFGYCEDTDLSIRIRKKFDLIVSPGIYVHHGGVNGVSTSLLQNKPKTIYNFFINHYKLGMKHHNFFEIFFQLTKRNIFSFSGKYTVSELFKEK